MAETYWPFDGEDTSETQYSQLFRRMQATGVWGDDSDQSCKLVAGTGLVPILKSGYALVRGHMYYNDADLPLTFAAGGAQDRIDRAILRLDPTANSIRAVVLPGTAGSGSPSLLTQTDAGVYEISLSRVLVPAGASSISSSNITDERPFMGHIFGEWTTTNRPTAPRKGQPGYNLTDGRPEYWDGATWKPFTPAITASMITDQQNITSGDSAKVGGHRVYVQATTPTTPAPAANDIWLW